MWLVRVAGGRRSFGDRYHSSNNVERIDVIFDSGIVTPVLPELMMSAGHVVAEMRGDNPVRVAAITALDPYGNPAAYSRVVRVNPVGCVSNDPCFGLTNKIHDYTLFKKDAASPQAVAVASSRDNVAMAFVSTQALGLNAGQTYFGLSLFADDVNAGSHDLLDPATFPADTGNSPDLYGGMGAYFLLGGTSVANAHVYRDENGNGRQEPDEPDLYDVSIKLFADNNNGVYDSDDTQIGQHFVTDGDGNIHIPALPNGNYWLLLDLENSWVPEGFGLPEGSNPVMFTVSAGPQISFGITRPTGIADDGINSVTEDADATGSQGGDSSGGDTGGGDTGGGDTGGGDTSGGDTSGGGTSGGDTSGGDTSGGGTGGGDTSGGGTSGGDTSGGSDGGGSGDDDPTQGADPVDSGDGFSDINGNGINDFDECDGCERIGLITGIDGSGAGSLGYGWLLILSLMLVPFRMLVSFRERGSLSMVDAGVER